MSKAFESIESAFVSRRKLHERIVVNTAFLMSIRRAYFKIVRTINSGNKILLFGNGGSASDAQHLAAELVCQFSKPRRAFAAIALTTDTSIITAQSNDFGFDTIFSRQLEALCQKGDLVIAFTTSDSRGEHSRNIYNGIKRAKELSADTIGFFSEKTKNLLKFTDVSLIVPSGNTAQVQEIHREIMHVMCELIDENLC